MSKKKSGSIGKKLGSVVAQQLKKSTEQAAKPAYEQQAGQEMTSAIYGAAQSAAARNYNTAAAAYQNASAHGGLPTYAQLQDYFSTVSGMAQATKNAAQQGVILPRNVRELESLRRGYAGMLQQSNWAKRLLNLTEDEYNTGYLYPSKYQNANRQTINENMARLKAVGDSGKGELNWLKENQYNYWTPDEIRKGIADTKNEIDLQKSQRRNNLILQDRLDKLRTASKTAATRDWDDLTRSNMEELARLTGHRSDSMRAGAAAQAMTPGTNNPILSAMTAHDAGKNDDRIRELYDYFRKKGYKDDEIAALAEYTLQNQHAQQRMKDLQELQEFGSRNLATRALSAAVSVPASVASGIGYTDLAAQAIGARQDPFTGERMRIDPYSGATGIGDAANVMRGAAIEGAPEPVKLAYNAFMSLADSYLAMQSGKGVTNVLLGGSAAMSTARSAFDRGASDWQALAAGGAAGIAEGLFEEFSIGRLRIMQATSATAKRTVKEFFLDWLKQGVTEGSEEGLTTLANTLTDAWIMGDKSELNTRIRELMAQNMSEEAATKQAYAEWAGQLGTDVLAGFLSGSMGNVVSGGLGSIERNAANFSTGQDIRKAGNMGAMIEQGLSAPEGSAAFIAAQRAQNAKEGSRRQARRVGETYQALQRGEARQAVQDRLEQLGAQNASETADAIMRQMQQQTLTSKQRKLLETKAAQRTMTEFSDAANGIEGSNTWASAAQARQFGRALQAFTQREREPQTIEAYSEKYGKTSAAVQQVYNMQPETDVQSFSNAFETAYALGREGANVEAAVTSEATQALTETQRRMAYDLGADAAKNGVHVELNSTLEGDNEYGGEIRVRAGGERNDGTRAAEPVRELAEGAEPAEGYRQAIAGSAKDSGASVLQYEAEAVSTQQIGITDGTRNRGIYLLKEDSPSTPAIDEARRIAKENGRNLVLFGGGNLQVREGGYVVSARGMYDPDTNTMFVRADHPEYDAGQIARHENGHGLIKEGKVSVKEVQRQMAKAMDDDAVKKALSDYANAYEGIDISDDALWEEIVCDALGDMNIFENIDLRTEQAQRVGERAAVIQQSVQEQTRGRAPPEPVSEETQEILNDAGVQLDDGNGSASPSLFSRETWYESEYTQDRDQAAQELSKALGISVTKAKRYISDVNSIAKMIADDRARLDYESSPDRSSFVGNTEYGGSIDFSTVCKKRRLYTGTIEAIQRAFPDRALTADELLKIRSYMAERGYEVNCGFCYVEGSRAKMGKYTKQFLDEYRASGADYVPTMAEMNTATGQEQIRREHPAVYDAYVKFMNKLAQRKPKLFQLATAYKGEILQKFKRGESVEEKNRNGGLRLQSFSDFEIIHLIDTMQVIMDMSRVGLAGQAYTKVPDFAWAFGRTGLKINISLVAKGVDENGRLVYDDVEGMDHNEAKKLRDAYSKNVGTILVVFDDAQLKAAMADDFVDFIIPFHRSQWSKKDYAKMGLAPTTKDYTSKQNERYIKPVYGTKKDGSPKKLRAENFMPNTYWDFNKSGKENAEEYLRMCAEANKRPKFANLLVDNKDGSFSLQPDGSTDGYWKLLIDFKMYDNKGRGSEQMPVRPDFNMNQARRMLNEYTGGHQSFPVAQDVVDHFKEELGGKKQSFSRELDTFTNKDDVDAEISHLKDQIRDIQNAQYAARDQAKSDPRVVEAQKRMWAAEDEKGYSGSFKERVEYRRILNKVKAEMETDIPEGDLNELAKRVKDLEELREQFLKVTPITNAQYQKLVDHFGTTEDYGVAGFILRDGRTLDFSGKKQYGSAYAGGREIYHNEIGDVLKLQSDTSPRINMVSNGNIRLVPEINGINLSQTPTAEQAKALRGFIEHYNGSVHVDIDNAAGRTVETFGYRKGTSASKILSDINSYFKTGASPAPQSELLSFYTENNRFSRDLSALDSDYLIAVENGDMETAQRMVDEAAKRAGYTVKGWHGTGNKPFSKFNYGRSGIYITTAEDVAKTYGGNVMPLYGTENNQLVIDADGHAHFDIPVPEWLRDEVDKYPLMRGKSDTDTLAKVARNLGYSSLRINNIDDSESLASGVHKLADDVVYFESLDNINFKNSQVKSADPITYDDDGNVIPLSERFNLDEADIRFSRDLESLSDLRRENRNLQKRLERAKAQTKLTTEAAPREEDVRRAARSVIQNAQSKMKVNDVAEDMTELAKYIMNGERSGRNREPASWTEVKERAVEIARGIVDNASALSEGSDPEMYKAMRQYLRSTKLTLAPQDRSDMQDGYSEFVKKNFGTLRLGNDGLPVDTAYQEMQEEFGKGFFPDDITHPADQLLQIADVVNGLKPIYENPHTRYYDEAVEWTANAIIDELLGEDVRQEAPTYADKAEARRKKDVAEAVAWNQYQAERREDRLKEQYRQRMQEALQKEKERRGRDLDRLKLKQKFKETAERERRQENAAQKKYRERIAKNAKTLGDWLLKNSDKEHIPEPLKKSVGEFLSALDFTSKRALKGGEQTQKDARYLQRLEALQETLAKQKNFQDGAEDAQAAFDGYLDLPSGYMDLLNEQLKTARAITERGEQNVINAMNAEQLRQLDEMVSTLLQSVRNINRLVSNGRFHSAIEAAQSTIEKLKAAREYKLNGHGVKRFLQWDNTNPFYAFRRFGDGGQAIFEGFQNGWDQFAFNVKNVLDFAEQAYTDKQVKAWTGEVHSFELESGEKVQLTTAQIMSLYKLLDREQARKHIEGGGIRIANIESGKSKLQQTDHFHFSAKDIDTIVGSLTKEQRNVADKLQKYMQEQGGKWGNEVSMQRFGYEAFGEEHYFPIQTESSDRNAVDPEAKANDLYRLLNMSATKSLNPNANNALVVSDIFDVFADHMSDMAKYNALALPILDAMKWVNYRERVDIDDEGHFRTETLQRSIERAYGSGAMQYITTFMKDLNGVRETSGRGEDFARKMMSNYKVAAVAANLRVALLQPTSYFRALYSVDGKHLAKGAVMNLKRGMEECEKYSGIAVWKGLGYYDTNISRGIREQIHDGGGVKEKAQELAMKGAEWGDRLTWGALWNACKSEVKAKNKTLSGEALMQATALKFREVVYTTQVVDSTMTRSHTMRGKSLYGGMATAFMSEPTLSYNMVLDAYMEFSELSSSTSRSEAWRRTRGKIGKAFGVYALSSVAAAIVESAMDAFRDDDDYQKWYQKFLEALIGGDEFKEILDGNLVNDLLIFNKLPIVKDAISLLSGYSSGRLDIEWMTNMVKSYNILKERFLLATGRLEDPTKVTYFGNMTDYGVIYQVLKTLSQGSGLPVSNLSREAVTIWNNTVGLFAPSKKVKTYDGGVKSNVKRAFTDGWLTEEEAIQQLLDNEVFDNEDDAYWYVESWKEDGGKFTKLLEAARAGDKSAFKSEMERITSHGVEEKKAQSALKSAVKEWYQGIDDDGEPIDGAKISKQQAIDTLVKFGSIDKEDAETDVQKWTAFNVTGIQYSDLKDAYLDGSITDSQYKKALQQYGGKSAEDADAALVKIKAQQKYGDDVDITSIDSVVEAAIRGDISVNDAKAIWSEYNGTNEKTVEDRAEKLQFVIDHPSVSFDDVSKDAISGYNEHGKAAQISVDDYMEWFSTADDFSSDYDAAGKETTSRKQKIIDYINSLPISNEKKTAMYVSFYSAKKIPAWT